MVGGANMRMKAAKLMMSPEKSDAGLPLLVLLTSLVVALRQVVELAPRIFLHALGEEIVRDTHFDVIGLHLRRSAGDLFCAFQPNRVMVPSLPLRLKVPEMPNDLLCCALAVNAA